MSGGHFDYDQYKISQIADMIEQLIISNDDQTLCEWGVPKGRGYPSEVIAQFKHGLDIIRRAFVYAQRIDWLVSGDDDPESFLVRLNQELQEPEQRP